MKFTRSWLNQFTSTQGLPSSEIADKLTMLGLEVDSIEELFEELEQITTARITDIHKHPDADKLTICTVDTGDQSIQVVCGAPNVRVGMLTALAQPGTKLPDGTKIKKAKVRGVVSFGMLCSAQELQINNDHSGILDLDETIATGIPLTEALGIRDTVIEVDLTPNRPDCASVRGIAREVCGFTGNRLLPLTNNVTRLTGENINYSVIIQNPELCPRYTARKLSHVTIGPSPVWMQQRLAAVGMRPINNIVDITNYVMLESGQPLHAFDFDTLIAGKIIVRKPKEHERELITLDGNVRQLESDMLLICDDSRPIAVAGVMGGLETEITEKTTTILLESACFDPVSIRRTARKLGIPSEASYRFERGVDPNLAISALERAVNLIVEITGAYAETDGIDVYPGEKPPLQLILRTERVNSSLGLALTSDEIAQYLQRIEFTVTSIHENVLHVTVPSFRIDIEREIDLIEEVARLVGYDNIPTTLPSIRMDYPQRDELRSLRQEVVQILTAQGFFEAINYSFVAENHLEHCRLADSDPRRKVTRLLNPLSEEQAIMRSMLLPGVLENVKRNINFQQQDIRLFEVGKVFLQPNQGSLPDEHVQLCVVVSGHRYPDAAPLYYANLQADFFVIKGVAVNLFKVLGLDDASLIVPQPFSVQPYCDPVCSAAVMINDNEMIGSLGAVHPETLRRFGIKQQVYYFEVDLQRLLTLDRKVKRFTSLPKFPAVKRDISLTVPDSIPAHDLLKSIQIDKQKYLESADIFDVYRGKPIPTGCKSVALTLTYRSTVATLDDQTVDNIHKKIVNSLMANFNAHYREGSDE